MKAVLGIARQRKQLQHGSGNHPQRALGADEKMFQIIAGIVFTEPPQAVPNPPVRQHHFETEDQGPGIAIAHHLGAAGIGRQIATDLAGSFGCQTEREQPSGLRRGGLNIRQNAAGLDRHGIVVDVDVADLVHPAGRQDDLAIVVVGLAGAGQAGIATLRHDRRAGLMTDPHYFGQFLGIRRLHDHRDQALPIVAPRLQQRRHIAGIGDDAFVADNLPDRRQHRGFDRFRCHLTFLVKGGPAQPVVDRPPDVSFGDRLHGNGLGLARV